MPHVAQPPALHHALRPTPRQAPRLCHQLRRWRLAAFLTQAELSARSGVSRGTIALIESAKQYHCTALQLQALAHALGCTLGDLRGEG